MDIPPETVLEDVLAGAKRLETISPFTIFYSLPNVLHLSKNILSSSFYTDEDIRRGQLLLPKQNENISISSILRNVEHSHLMQTDILTFSEKSIECFQNIIVKSIEYPQIESEKLNEEFILNAIQNKRKNLQNQRQKSSDHSNASVEIGQFDKYLANGFNQSQQQQIIYILTPQIEFYVNLIQNRGSDLADEISTAIKNSEHDNFTIDLNNILADTYELISDVSKARPNYINGSLHFLERQFKKILVYNVNSNLKTANRGGKIGIIDSIKGYLNLKKGNFKHYNSPWAIIFFALRCGETTEAFKYAQDNSSDFDRDVITALGLRVNNTPLFGDIQSSLESYFAVEKGSPTCDPFKALSLSVITKSGGFLDNHIIDTLEDWIWLHMQLSGNVKNMLNSLGNIGNDEVENPFMRGQILLELGEFDSAARWFLDRQDNIIDCLHLAITMHTNHLIGADIIYQALLNHSIDVFKSDKIAAVQYLSLLEDNKYRIRAIAELAAIAAEGETVFTNIEDEVSPVTRILGPIVQRESLIAAANEAKSKGQNEKAILFYKMAGDYNNVVDLECTELQHCIDNERDEDMLYNAYCIYNEISETRIPVDPSKIETMKILLFVARASLISNTNNFNEILDNLDKTGIIPSSFDQVDICCRKILYSSQYVHKVLPKVLLLALNSYYQIFQSIPPNNREFIKTKAEILIRLAEKPQLNNLVPQKTIRDLLNMRQELN